MSANKHIEPLISVVVPVYNVEKYLGKCLDSLLGQEYGNLEILCVNDGSPDNSLQILQEYAAKDSRIKVISQENQGLSGARNTGMRAAKGSFIYFIDSDDWISANYLRSLYDALVSSGADVAINGQYAYVWDDGKVKIKKLRYKGVFEENKQNLRKTLGFVMAWNKLYRRDFLEKSGIFYPLGVTCEDCYFYYTVFTKVKKLAIVNDGMYYYRQNNASLMSQIKSGSRLYDHIRIFYLIYDYYKEQNLLKDYYLPFNLLKSYVMYHQNKKEAFGQVREILRKLEYGRGNVSRMDRAFVKMLRDWPYPVFGAYLIWRNGFKSLFKKKRK